MKVRPFPLRSLGIFAIFTLIALALAFIAFPALAGNVAHGPLSTWRLSGKRANCRWITRDARLLGEGVVVGRAEYEQKLAGNKQNYVEQIVNSTEFIARFPLTQDANDFVSALYSSAGVSPTSHGSGKTAGRAAALRTVAESNSLSRSEFTAAFVLMQYHGYLRRNPTDVPDCDDSGYQFWLSKLNQFGGNFVAAEMVKAFINATEYRRRFGP